MRRVLASLNACHREAALTNAPQSPILGKMSTQPASLAPTQVATLADFGAIYREYAPRVLAFLRSQVPPGFGVEELQHEVWLRVRRHLEQQESLQGRLLPWILDLSRSVLSDSVGHTPQRGSAPLSDFASDPLAVLLRIEPLRQLEQCLAKLPAEQRDLIRQRAGGRKTADLAAERKVQLATFARWLQQAQSALRKCIAQGEAP